MYFKAITILFFAIYHLLTTDVLIVLFLMQSFYSGGKKSSNPYEKFNFMKYMVGEEFFKNTDSSDDLNDADDDLEQIPYQVIKKERVRKC